MKKVIDRARDKIIDSEITVFDTSHHHEWASLEKVTDTYRFITENEYSLAFRIFFLTCSYRIKRPGSQLNCDLQQVCTRSIFKL